MTEISRRTFGSILVAGAATVAGVAAAGSPAIAATPEGEAAGSPQLTPTAVPDVQLTEAFRRFGDSGGGWPDRGGWAASDGTYTAELPGRQIVWLMNDTFLGPVNADESMTNPGFIHGSILLGGRDGTPVNTITGGTRTAPLSIASPPDAVNGDPWYWNAAGIFDGGRLQVFQGRIGQTDGPPPWNFGWLGSDIVTYAPDFTVEKVTRTYGAPGWVNWGNELLRVGGYVYIYGEYQNAMYVARARSGHLLDRDWEFYAGSSWSADENAATAVVQDLGASYSVSLVGDQYVLSSTASAIFVDHEIYVATAPTPVGPFSPRIGVYDPPESQVPGIYTYNVAAHPQISDPGELVVSYNVNAQNGSEILANANNNRPRFIRITF
ncbi:MAG: hypothetical protein FWE39_00160 [Nocardiaceae bacterium]|nr:hypothetical protein [Nocardiaceae bacterium]